MKLITLALATIVLCVNVMFGTPPDKDQSVIAKIEGLSSIQNVEIHDLFKHDANVQVVNSCQLLGLIVFKSTSEKGLTVQELEGYVQVKLKFYSKSQSVTFLKDVSMSQVNVNCRAEVAKSINKK